MNLDLLMLRGFYAFVCLFGFAFFYQRYRWRRRKRRGYRHLGFYPTAGAMGNALHQLQQFAQPHEKYVIAEMLDEEADEDDAGGPDDPTRHLHKQARKIRRGEEIDRITVLLPKD